MPTDTALACFGPAGRYTQHNGIQVYHIPFTPQRPPGRISLLTRRFRPSDRSYLGFERVLRRAQAHRPVGALACPLHPEAAIPF